MVYQALGKTFFRMNEILNHAKFSYSWRHDKAVFRATVSRLVTRKSFEKEEKSVWRGKFRGSLIKPFRTDR